MIDMKHYNYSPSFAASVVLHTVILLMFVVGFEFTSAMPVVENSDKDMKVISAVIMDSRMPKPEVQPVARPRKVAEKPQIEPVKPPAPTPQELLQQQKLLDAQIEQDAIAINARQQEQAAKQLLADMKKQAVTDKKLKETALQKEMEKEFKEQTAKSLQQQLLHEQQHAVGAKVRGEVNKYKALILQAISERWLVPAGVDKTLSSELLIRVAPGGMVLDVEVTRTSGDAALDRSARDAVFKASPLPVPDDSDAFDQFRQFVLKMKPQNLVASDA
jgi:colicin import membrane protein